MRDISGEPAPCWRLEEPADETELVRRREKREADVEVVEEEVRGRPFGVDAPLRLVAEDLWFTERGCMSAASSPWQKEDSAHRKELSD